MPGRPVGVTDTATAAGVAEIDVIERASPDVFSTITADPTTGTSLAVTLRDRFPQSGSFKVKVDSEVMLVTAGHGTGAGTFTVTRGQDGTTNVAHANGSRVSQVVGVQRVEPVDGSREILYRGRANTFRQLGRAGTTGQKILAIHNATASPRLVDVDRLSVDRFNALAIGKIGTVIPPIVRLWKFTAVPTNGTALTKVPEDSGLASIAAVTVWGDSSADGVNSGTTLTVTLPAGTFITQEFAADRQFGTTGTGTNPWYEPWDKNEFLVGENNFVTLRPLEGLCLFLDYTSATANPITDHWLATLHWTEYLAA